MNRENLVKTLELLQPALAKDDTVPIFQCFTLNEGSVCAYNDSLGIVGPLEDTQHTPSGIALHGSTLYGLLSSSRSEEVLFSTLDDQIAITAGKTVSKLPHYDESQFIFEIPEDRWNASTPCDQEFIQALNICLDTVSKDTTQAALNGVTIEGGSMFSCDGDALTSIEVKSLEIGKSRAMLQTEFCDAVLRLCTTLGTDEGTLSFSDEWMRFQYEEWAIYGRVLQIPDPIDFKSEIKKTLKGKKVEYRSLPDNFKGSLIRARVLADPESKKTKLTIKSNNLEVFTETHMGEVKDTMAFGHADVVADVNAAYLQRALKYCDQIAIFDNCVLFRGAPNVLQLISNMG
jgi:DNA polymerase III sliding clamp (beta) subunit (PCNA family)